MLINSSSADLNVINNSGSSLMYINATTGNVGIGTITPTATLQVNSSNAAGALNVINTSGSSMLFVNGTSGRVGIGTTSPGALLDLYKDAGNTGITELRISQAYSVDGYTRLRSYQDSIGFALSENWAQGTSADATGDYVGTRDYSSRAAGQFGFVAGTTAAGSHFDFAGALGDTLSSLMRIQLDGNVGIGTTTPNKELVVNGTSDALVFAPSETMPTINTTGITNMTITSSGGSVIIRLG